MGVIIQKLYKKDNSIAILQKKAIRCLHRTNFRAHTLPLFKRAKILKINELYEFQIAKIIFKSLHNSELKKITPIDFSVTGHNHGTRLNDHHNYPLQIPRKKLRLAQNDISFVGPTIWNLIPTSIKNVNSFRVFKCNLLNYLLNRYSE